MVNASLTINAKKVASVTIDQASPENVVFESGQISQAIQLSGKALDNQATPQPVPNANIWAFLNLGTASQKNLGNFKTDASGSWSYTLSYAPTTFPESDTFSVADNSQGT